MQWFWFFKVGEHYMMKWKSPYHFPAAVKIARKNIIPGPGYVSDLIQFQRTGYHSLPDSLVKQKNGPLWKIKKKCFLRRVELLFHLTLPYTTTSIIGYRIITTKLLWHFFPQPSTKAVKPKIVNYNWPTLKSTSYSEAESELTPSARMCPQLYMPCKTNVGISKWG